MKRRGAAKGAALANARVLRDSCEGGFHCPRTHAFYRFLRRCLSHPYTLFGLSRRSGGLCVPGHWSIIYRSFSRTVSGPDESPGKGIDVGSPHEILHWHSPCHTPCLHSSTENEQRPRTNLCHYNMADNNKASRTKEPLLY